MTYMVLHHADCTNCGHRAKSSESSTFITPFFLPRHCEGCGEYRSSSDFNNRDYVIGMTKYKWGRPKFNPWNPLTIFKRWIEVEVTG